SVLHGFAGVQGTAAPAASQSRAWNIQFCAHDSDCSFWHTLSSNSLRPALSWPAPVYWSMRMPWWYSARAKISLPLRKILTALVDPTRTCPARPAGASMAANAYATTPFSWPIALFRSITPYGSSVAYSFHATSASFLPLYVAERSTLSSGG